VDNPNNITLILASLNPEDIKFFWKISQFVGFPLVLVKDVRSLEDALAGKRNSSFLFIDADAVDRVSSQAFPSKLLTQVLSRMTSPARVIATVGDPAMRLDPEVPRAHVGHVFCRRYDEFGEKWAKTLILAMVLGRTNDLSDFKGLNGEMNQVKLVRSVSKRVAIDDLRGKLTDMKFPHKVAEVILSSFDELIMNALFDAPMDDGGKRYRREVPRDADFLLNNREEVTLTWIQNPTFTLIGVTDQFGSLDGTRATEAAFQDYTEMPYLANPKTKSARLGLNRITSTGVSYMALVKPGLLTHAVLIFPNLKSLRELRESFRSFSLVKLG
jgi:hypothetical protein